MKKVLIGVMLGLFLSGVGIESVQAEEHTKEYLEWEEKTINSMKLGTRCLEVKKGIKNLADEIKEKHSQDQKSLEAISNYVGWIHKAFIILERDNGAKGLSMTKTLDILGPPPPSSSVEPVCWFKRELLKAMEPLDKLAYIADKTPKEVDIISSAKLDGIRFLHVIVEELKNGGDFRKAIQEVDAFEEKLRLLK